MIGIPFIKSLFGAILDQSKVMHGRFHLCPFWGTEINKGNIAEIVTYIDEPMNQASATAKQKYPAVLLMPMKEVGNFQYPNDNSVQNSYNLLECTMVFITNAYVTGANQTSSPAIGSGQPTHTIPDTWHDMGRCAKNFLEVLYNGISAQGLQSTIFISENHKSELLEVTCKGNDSVSGVLMRFYIALASGCDLEDYNSDYLTATQWPTVTDSHPLHLDV